MDTLEVYRRLGVKEVWYWQNQQFTIHCLQNDSFQRQSQSELLPNLDLGLLAQYVAISDPLEAITQWRKEVRVN